MQYNIFNTCVRKVSNGIPNPTQVAVVWRHIGKCEACVSQMLGNMLLH